MKRRVIVGSDEDRGSNNVLAIGPRLSIERQHPWCIRERYVDCGLQIRNWPMPLSPGLATSAVVPATSTQDPGLLVPARSGVRAVDGLHGEDESRLVPARLWRARRSLFVGLSTERSDERRHTGRRGAHACWPEDTQTHIYGQLKTAGRPLLVGLSTSRTACRWRANK